MSIFMRNSLEVYPEGGSVAALLLDSVLPKHYSLGIKSSLPQLQLYKNDTRWVKKEPHTGDQNAFKTERFP